MKRMEHFNIISGKFLTQSRFTHPGCSSVSTIIQLSLILYVLFPFSCIPSQPEKLPLRRHPFQLLFGNHHHILQVILFVKFRIRRPHLLKRSRKSSLGSIRKSSARVSHCATLCCCGVFPACYPTNEISQTLTCSNL